jgi:hypothetical protein
MNSVFDWRDDSAPRIVKSRTVIRHPGAASPTAVRVAQYGKDGDLIATYPSMKAAARATSVDFRGVSKVVSGERKTAGGFVFKEIAA